VGIEYGFLPMEILFGYMEGGANIMAKDNLTQNEIDYFLK
jgi:hypothetical protein